MPNANWLCGRLLFGMRTHQTQMALGDRGIWQDDAVWLPEIDATQKGMTLRRLMCRAVEAVVEAAGSAPKDALRPRTGGHGGHVTRRKTGFLCRKRKFLLQNRD